MADQKQKKNSQGGADNVVAMPSRCKTEGCTQKSVKADFCSEHFDWFKEGLVTKEGKKPIDFERKLYYFNRRKSAA